jgi:hypothetical protein
MESRQSIALVIIGWPLEWFVWHHFVKHFALSLFCVRVHTPELCTRCAESFRRQDHILEQKKRCVKGRVLKTYFQNRDTDVVPKYPFCGKFKDTESLGYYAETIRIRKVYALGENVSNFKLFTDSHEALTIDPHHLGKPVPGDSLLLTKNYLCARTDIIDDMIADIAIEVIIRLYVDPKCLHSIHANLRNHEGCNNCALTGKFCLAAGIEEPIAEVRRGIEAAPSADVISAPRILPTPEVIRIGERIGHVAAGPPIQHRQYFTP